MSSTTSTTTTPRSPRLTTAHAVIESYSTLSAASLLSHCAPSFTYRVLPASLGMPPRDKDAFLQQAGRIFSIFSSFAMVPQQIFEDDHSNAVIVYAKMVGELKGLGPWENECVIVLRMSEDGTEVVEQTEFVDSAKANELREKMARKTSEKEASALMHD